MAKRIAVFVDSANVYNSARLKYNGRRIDLEKLLLRIIDGFDLERAFMYGTLINQNMHKFVSAIQHIGYEPKYLKPYRHGKLVDANMRIAFDVVRLIGRIDIVAIASSDLYMLPCIEWIQEQGIRCTIYGTNIPNELRHAANNWFEIDESLLLPETENVPDATKP